MSKAVIMVSYWPTSDLEDNRFKKGVLIRHTSHADAAVVAHYQTDPRAAGPSACVFMVPATNPEDPDYERSPALERARDRVSSAAYWLGQVPRECYYSMNLAYAPGFVMFSYFSFQGGELNVGQCEVARVEDVGLVREALERNGRKRANYRYENGRPVLCPPSNN